MNNKKEIRKLYQLIQEDVLQTINSSKKYGELGVSLLKYDDLLKKSLDNPTYEILEKYINFENEISLLETEEAFVYGFALANKLFIDSLK